MGLRNTPMQIGDGNWTAQRVMDLYRSICQQRKMAPRPDLRNEFGDHPGVAFHFALDTFIDLAKAGDLPSIELVLRILETDDSMPFGMTLKSRGSRALKRQAHLLTEGQRHRVMARVRNMEARGYTPREFKEYARLSRFLQRNLG